MFPVSIGELAEWSNAAVLKTVELKGSGGSNPSLSAIKFTGRRVLRKEFSLRRLAIRVQAGIVHK